MSLSVYIVSMLLCGERVDYGDRFGAIARPGVIDAGIVHQRHGELIQILQLALNGSGPKAARLLLGRALPAVSETMSSARAADLSIQYAPGRRWANGRCCIFPRRCSRRAPALGSPPATRFPEAWCRVPAGARMQKRCDILHLLLAQE